jgi:Arc/MetJ-type ribon-helix-helix transcriptional regulator
MSSPQPSTSQPCPALRIPLCIASCYACVVPQLVTRIDDETATAIDALVDDGEFASRSDVVRAGILRLVDERRRRKIGDEIIAGYQRVPETPEELSSAETNARAMIADEPW